jgi:SnoaL-like domain
MAEHPNTEVFKRVYAAFTAGDMDRLAELIAPDAVWHVPGTNLISGEYTSREVIFGCFNKIFELSQGTSALSSMTSWPATITRWRCCTRPPVTGTRRSTRTTPSSFTSAMAR